MPCTEHKTNRERFGTEVGDIARHCEARMRASCALGLQQHKVLTALARCRTAALGGHVQQCDACGRGRIAYNSCRNRHCPKCQAMAQYKWLEARRVRMLPTHHFHVVFTLPAELRPLVLAHPRQLFAALFASASATLLELGRDPARLGGQVGITAVLHTWTRDLSFHPHLHCVVTGGGWDADARRWRACPAHFLFPVQVMGALFRGKMLHAVRGLAARERLPHAPDDLERTLSKLSAKRWLVYSKAPFGGADQVYAYLGRYTHRSAISNGRVLSFDGERVHFRTRYPKSTTLPALVFLRRMLWHVLPSGFVRVRHYGLLSPAGVRGVLPAVHAALAADGPAPPRQSPAPVAPRNPSPPPSAPESERVFWRLTGIDLGRCPHCRARAMRSLPLPQAPPARAPPETAA